MASKEREEFIASLKVKEDKSPHVKSAKGVIYPKYKVKNGIDGLAHIDHTTHIGSQIAIKECDDEIHNIILGCLLHDIGRGHETIGQTHGDVGGPIAKNILEEYFKKYDVDIDKLVYAIKNHDKGRVTTDRMIGSIWDADRLSLYRFKGREINMDLLSTEAAKELLDYAKSYIEKNMSDYYLDFEKNEGTEHE